MPRITKKQQAQAQAEQARREKELAEYEIEKADKAAEQACLQSLMTNPQFMPLIKIIQRMQSQIDELQDKLEDAGIKCCGCGTSMFTSPLCSGCQYNCS